MTVPPLFLNWSMIETSFEIGAVPHLERTALSLERVGAIGTFWDFQQSC